jgi:two-component system response regulator NreC
MSHRCEVSLSVGRGIEEDFMGLSVVIVENHTILRQGLKRLLEDRGFDIAGETDNGREGVEMVEEKLPDIVVMDISMPKLGGIEATRQIKKRHPEIKVIILTIHMDEIYVYRALEAGANGYLVKEQAADGLIKAIDMALDGEIYLSPDLPEDILENYREMVRKGKKVNEFSRLTVREKEILKLIAEGNTSRQIAESLFISVKTVENHRANIKNKIDIHDTAGLVRYALKIGLIESEKL